MNMKQSLKNVLILSAAITICGIYLTLTLFMLVTLVVGWYTFTTALSLKGYLDRGNAMSSAPQDDRALSLGS